MSPLTYRERSLANQMLIMEALTLMLMGRLDSHRSRLLGQLASAQGGSQAVLDRMIEKRIRKGSST